MYIYIYIYICIIDIYTAILPLHARHAIAAGRRGQIAGAAKASPPHWHVPILIAVNACHDLCVHPCIRPSLDLSINVSSYMRVCTYPSDIDPSKVRHSPAPSLRG